MISDLNYCTNNEPCDNGGVCINTGESGFICDCAPDFKGTKCEMAMNYNCSIKGCENGGFCVSKKYRVNCIVLFVYNMESV